MIIHDLGMELLLRTTAIHQNVIFWGRLAPSKNHGPYGWHVKRKKEFLNRPGKMAYRSLSTQEIGL